MTSPTVLAGRGGLHDVLLPVAGLVVLVLCVLIGLLWYGADRQDEIARTRSIELVQRIVEDAVDQVSRQVKDYAWWNAAVDALVIDLDRGWADENVGPYVQENFGYEFSFVVDQDGATTYAALFGTPTDADPLSKFDGSLDRLIERTRRDSARYEPQAVAGLVGTVHGPVVAGAARLTPEYEGDPEPPEGRSAVLVFGDLLDDAFWQEFATRYDLAGFRALPPGAAGIMLPLTAVDGTDLGGLAWKPHRPGAAYFRSVMPLVVGATVFVTMLTASVLDRATRALAASEARFRDVADASSDWIWETDARGRLTFLSERFADMTGIAPDDVLAHALPQVLSPVCGSGESSLTDILASARPFRSVLCRHEDRDGVERMVRLAGKPILGPGGTLLGHRGTATDVTREVEAERRVRFLALHDPLTGLPNRSALQDRLESAIANALRRSETLAVICLDLDGLKDVNDTLGHAAGDLLIERVGERLRTCVRAVDTVARLGGDEFVILQIAAKGPDDVDRLCRRIIEALAVPIELDATEVVVTASLGVSVVPQDGREPARLLQNADIALYRAKEEGGNGVRFFEPRMDTRLRERKALEQDLRAALASGALELHYQPQLAIDDQRLLGVEALLRWRHPTRGEVPPSTFIPIAEESGLIVPLGEWVLREACRQAAAWPDLIMSVNLSPVQFRHRDLVTVVRRALEDSGLAPRRLELEITESALRRDADGTFEKLRALQALGVRISMDDFGSGYSSIAHLRHFTFDKLKIDKSFVHNLAVHGDADGIVRAVMVLGESLNVQICAEGVETAEQLAFLAREGCNEVQGFYFHQALPADEISRLYFDGAATTAGRTPASRGASSHAPPPPSGALILNEIK